MRAWDDAKWFFNIATSCIYFISSIFFSSYVTAAFGCLIFLIGFPFAIVISVLIFFISGLWNLFLHFIYSVCFNWQSLFIIIVIFLVLFVIAIIWGLVRDGVNGSIIPGLLFVVQEIINPMIRILKKALKMIGLSLPFDEIDEDALKGGMPTLLSIVLMVLKPFLNMILSPLRAEPADEMPNKCKKKIL